MSELIGKWDFESDENMDNYLAAMGVGFMLRKVASTASILKPRVVFERNGQNWKINMTSLFKNQSTSFTEGVPFEEVMLDGRESTNVIIVESDSRMVQEQTVGGLKSVWIRENLNGKYVETLTCDGVTGKRIFKRA